VDANHTSNRASAQKGATMASQFEQDCREFARQYPTPNTLRAIALCEAGTLEWDRVADLFTRSLAAGIREVAS